MLTRTQLARRLKDLQWWDNLTRTFQEQESSDLAELRGFQSEIRSLADADRDTSDVAEDITHRVREFLALPPILDPVTFPDEVRVYPVVRHPPTVKQALSPREREEILARNKRQAEEMKARAAAAKEERALIRARQGTLQDETIVYLRNRLWRFEYKSVHMAGGDLFVETVLDERYYDVACVYTDGERLVQLKVQFDAKDRDACDIQITEAFTFLIRHYETQVWKSDASFSTDTMLTGTQCPTT